MDIQKVGVIGAGQMGNGIAHVLALAGYQVTITDLNQAALDNARIVQSCLIKVRYRHLISGQRQNMRNTIAHLPGPDHSNFLNIHAARSF